MATFTTIELTKENLEFSAGHFTIFSATHRERWHGHNFRVAAKITAEVTSDRGMAFDYAVYKEILRQLCNRLDSYFLLPTQSPYLTITESGEYYHVNFHQDRMVFLQKDVLLLPVSNITVEALAQWFITELTTDAATIAQHRVVAFDVQVFSGPGQSANAQWQR